MTKLMKLAGVALLSFNAHTQATSAPGPDAFVPPAYKVVETIRGDLNKDGQDDVVLVVKHTDAANIITNDHGREVDRNRRGLIIALRTGATYVLAVRNLNCFSSENEDGGVYFPPELSVSIENAKLVIAYGHGRYGYWSYTFRYQSSGFFLIGYDNSENNGPVVRRVTSINLLSQKMVIRENVDEDADGGADRFRETWSRIRKSKAVSLADIDDFDAFSVEQELGLSR
ncbi:hypothetical protein [Dyella sp.]|uniref:hypothetical protein n=1 Tax=Dyella sp. TaxID=1869338 RepID=UPI002D78314A|nr:hypothetical protein [Dyella sp.]HET6431420.1 hypothetical protein [Dyella sp.]